MKLLWFLCIFPACSWAIEEWFVPRSVVFVYDLANISTSKIEDLAARFSDEAVFFDGKHLSLNITIIPSFQPDNITTIQALDPDIYTNQFYKNLFTQYSNVNAEEFGSLKALLKAVEICPRNGYIVMQSNTKVRDTNLLREIALKTLHKDLEIEFDSTLRPPQYPPLIVQDFESLESFFILIIQKYKELERSHNDILKLWRKCKASGTTTSKPPLTHNNENVAAIIYDSVNITKDDLDNITNLMVEYYANRTKPGHIRGFPIFDSVTGLPTFLDVSKNYTVDDFKAFITLKNASTTDNTSLKALLKAMQFANSQDRIVYFANQEPADKYELLPEVLQQIYRDKIEMKFHKFGSLQSRESPSIFKAIAFASWDSLSK